MKIGLKTIVIIVSGMLFFSCTGKNVKQANTGGNVQEKESAVSIEKSVPGNMISFEGGTFLMGSESGMFNERPVHEVAVKPFSIGKYPVTVSEFRGFVKATGYRTDADKFGNSGVFDFKVQNWTLMSGANWEYPLGKEAARAADDHPVTQVSWNDAIAYCNWLGKRLPTEAEWEFAARCGGKDQSRFSWGSELISNGKYMANVWQGNDLLAKQGADGFELTSPVGFYGETPCGMTDMGGNVWNWCADSYKLYPGNTSTDQSDPELKVIRGGSFFFDQNGENSYAATGRASNTSETSLFNIGFRCAEDLKEIRFETDE
ncbi:MAG: formylglycine-generating enzyme family protein [Prolixibacteraceae bacterium]